MVLNATNPVPGGTGAVLQLNNLIPAQLGSYSVLVSNAYGSVTSAPVELSVVAPVIVSGPASQVVTNGQTATLSVVASGSKPLAYQWYFNESNPLPGAINPTLVLNPVLPEEAGLYSVVVSNAYGSVISAPANLVVIVLPTLTCGSNRTVEVGTPWDFDSPVATGTNVTVTVVQTVTNLGCGDALSATRTWVVTDMLGNQATCSQTVQVVDTRPPVMNCAANKSAVLGMPWSFDVPQAQDAGVVPVLVYDNWTNDLGSTLTVGAEEVGNQITLAGTERYATRFAVQYWGRNTLEAAFAGPVSAEVRFYANDGPPAGTGPAPGTLLYDSGPLGINATPIGAIVLQEFELSAVVPLTSALPDSFTWTVQFQGMSASDVVGFSLFGPPVVGQSPSGYWARSAGGWQWQGQGGGGFGGQLSAVSRGVALTVANTVTNATCGNGFNATRTWRASDACGNSATCSQTVQVVDQGPPAIVSQPQNVTFVAGQTGALEVVVSSCPPLGYQWYFNGTNLLAGATDATLVFNPVVPGQAGSYTVVITNGFGSVTSSPAVVTVGIPASILSNPASVVATNGNTVALTVQADGSMPLFYQWYFNQVGLLPYATNSVLQLSSVSLAQAGLYTVVVTNAYGSVTSTPATLTVYSAPVIASQPQPQTVTAGGTAVFVVSATGSPALSYQWLWNGTNSLAGADGPILIFNNVQNTQAGLYSVVVSNLLGSVTSVPVALTINAAAPAITLQPVSVTTMQGQTVVFSVTASGAPPLAYQWYANCANPIAGSTLSTLRLKAVQPTDSGNYCVAVSNNYGRVLSQPATLRVLVQPSPITINQTPQAVYITFPTVRNLLYTAYASDVLSSNANAWTLLPGAYQQIGTGTPMTVPDPLVPQVHRFYKVVVE